MAHIWLKSETGAAWTSCGLSERAVTLTPVATGLRLDSSAMLPTPREREVLYESTLPNGSRQWILLAPPQLGVRVNGWPADLALVALRTGMRFACPVWPRRSSPRKAWPR